MTEKYDVIIIGAGPGGYVSAIRAAQLGKTVAIIEKNNAGGTCLNVGCIPSKTLLEHGKKVHDIQSADEWGIHTSNLTIDAAQLTSRKVQVVQTLTSGVTHLLKKNKVSYYKGEAKINSDLTVTVNDETLSSQDVVLATGSRPFVPPIPGLENVDYETTDTFFDMEALPKSLVVIGGGVIATELASSMADLGVKVNIVEVADDILLTEIDEVRALLREHLESQGIEIITSADIEKVEKKSLHLKGQDTISFDRLLVATGRQPNIEIVNDLELSRDGKYLQVDVHYQTSKAHLYAIGDLTSGYQLAHAASAHGIHVAEHLAGMQPKTIKQEDITRCIYTRLEAASVGLSAEQAEALGYEVKVTTSGFQGNAKAIIKGEGQGFVQLVIDEKYKEILGAFIVGPHATDLIGELLGVKASEGTIAELSEIIQPHPALLEAIGEGADAYYNQAIHM
ncbi:dihydrolipoyl dehydrogenase [Staphylococcus lugdunensis]|nr:dihydrolipoyl dehydrogenase [Staphylococcus lugdunensis]EFU83387.1 dihydrolipoyl dehydrogenase [Staphylococcus lugdunensis M23590]